MRKLGSLAVALLVACGGGGGASAPATPAPARELQPGPKLERDLRHDAARLLGCPAAAIALERLQWSGAQGTYRVAGCGQDAEYLVVCEADDVCGFVR